MKNTLRNIVLVALLSMATIGSAQQVATLYFLENAPMRHVINPAFQPVSNGYVNFSPLGYSSIWVGNNSVTMSDFIYKASNGATVTALHPEYGDRDALLNAFRNVTLIDGDMTLGILNFGSRINEKGYWHVGINLRAEGGMSMGKDFPRILLGGGMQNLGAGEVNHIDLNNLGATGAVFTEIGGGYSHKINDQWTVGGKLKFLLGMAYAGAISKSMGIDASTDEWHLKGDANVLAAGGAMNWNKLPGHISKGSLQDFDFNSLLPSMNTVGDYLKIATPCGYGAAFDFGATYKPIENLQITASITDLGFIYWTGRKYTAQIDTVFTGVGEFDYSKYTDENGKFLTDSLTNDVTRSLQGLVDNLAADSTGCGFVRMPSAKLNVGIDANFWDNRIGIGILSKTRLYNNRLYEEITFGAALRPCNWFNVAVSYSLLNNGKYSNYGLGLSFMPYDGINLTLAADYIPTSFAQGETSDGKTYTIPYKSKGLNVALGFSIVWGTNQRDKDKDGVYDKLDMCPNTPKNVQVDALGCPIDSDGDGVPDYLDKCPGTSEKAYGLIDAEGCELDTDSDGVADYLDECPGTPIEARGFIDEKGCELDTDSDGIPDWKDKCPNTPIEARGYTDEFGCELDTDSDGVADYLDKCPNTPAEARNSVDANGCELDTDGDSVPDWKDECPKTRKEAIGHVDEKGCELDTDGDGVPDWQDECPEVVGTKANKGCPEIKREIRKLLQKAMQGIEFETGKATIKKKSYPLLDQIAAVFVENNDYVIEVQGHTDNVGKAEMNKTLSQKRAESVMHYMVDKGVGAERISAVGYGMEQPIADNKTKAGRQKNRRVEFKITFEEVHTETILDHADSTVIAQQDSIQAIENTAAQNENK